MDYHSSYPLKEGRYPAVVWINQQYRLKKVWEVMNPDDDYRRHISTLTVHYPEVDIMVCAFARILLSNSWPAILYLDIVNCCTVYNLQHMVCITVMHTYLLDILSNLYRGTTILKLDDQNLFSLFLFSQTFS